MKNVLPRSPKGFRHGDTCERPAVVVLLSHTGVLREAIGADTPDGLLEEARKSLGRRRDLYQQEYNWIVLYVDDHFAVAEIAGKQYWSYDQVSGFLRDSKMLDMIRPKEIDKDSYQPLDLESEFRPTRLPVETVGGTFHGEFLPREDTPSVGFLWELETDSDRVTITSFETGEKFTLTKKQALDLMAEVPGLDPDPQLKRKLME